MLLADLQELLPRTLTLLFGVPGAGKSAFCHQIVLKSIAAEMPVIFVTTEQPTAGLLSDLEARGLVAPAS